ncbi:MAG: RNA polymerase factor sigma-54 [Phycisphaerales bacterium]|nr:RNA polymerase factor sigma-54 [Phycisphaerales bacterium]
MSQILSQRTSLGLAQEQRLTPQLIQAMEILQLPLTALEARLDRELDENPALEAAPLEGEFEPDAAPADRDSGLSENDPLVVGENQADEFERLDSLVRAYDDADDEYSPRLSRQGASDEADSKQEAMNNTAARPISLQEYLHEQWAYFDVDEETHRIGARVIDLLDESGRLATPLEEIAAGLNPPVSIQQVQIALHEVQHLDPPGVAARTLVECFLLQLRAMPTNTTLEQAIVKQHLEDLEKNRLPAIAKTLNVDVDDVKAAIGVISRLSMHPGAEVAERQTPPIVPDVIVEYNAEADRYDVRLARGNTRELRISPEFRELIERSRDDKDAREFARKKIEAANAIIDALRFRRERLLDVARAVVDAQRDFFDRGEQHMKVLRMSELADKFECDPSTISRTVDEKYLETPRGILPLRRFFTGGVESETGEALGWDSVKAKMKEVIDTENKNNPLSDDQIVDELQKAGIDIKRRTVAKYRAQLNIPAARQRKQY